MLDDEREDEHKYVEVLTSIVVDDDDEQLDVERGDELKIQQKIIELFDNELMLMRALTGEVLHQDDDDDGIDDDDAA